MKFIIHDADGNILRAGICPKSVFADQAHKGETAREDTWDGTDDRKHRIVDGERVEFTPEPPAPLSFVVQRAIAYPPIGDQLDALWHAMDVGVLPMVPAFYDSIKAVKDSLPLEAVK